MTTDSGRRVSRVISVVAATVLAAVVMVIGSAVAGAEDLGRTGQQQRNAETIRAAFALGVGGEDGFYSILAEDVKWTVARAVEPTTYTTRSQFLKDGAGPVLTRLTGPIRANVRELITEGDVVVAAWDGTATARDGRPYVNSYVWVMTLRDDRVVRVTAYLDLVALNELFDRVRPS